MSIITQQLWDAREDLRKQWEEFLGTEAGRKGIELMERSKVPFSTNEEPPAVKISRLDRMAGFHECIKMLRSLPHAGNRKDQATPSEWEHVIN